MYLAQLLGVETSFSLHCKLDQYVRSPCTLHKIARIDFPAKSGCCVAYLGGDDGCLYPSVTGDPYSPETWSVGHLIDQDLLMKWAALIGRKLSSLERTTVTDCLFHKRKMRFEEDTIVLEAPLATVIRRMIYPDKEKKPI